MKRLLQFFLCVSLPLVPVLVAAAPTGYSINSDEPDGDSLYAIDLATGQETLKGKVQSLGETRTDVEGLAFDRFGVLWGVDDESGHFFPINTANGQVLYQNEVPLTGLSSLGGNDFGLTFTCSDAIYFSSVSTQSLFQLQLDGTATRIGNEGALGANISAIAAWGNPTQLYGLGNGLLTADGPVDNRSLYSIDTTTGVATQIGTLGGEVADYLQAGLSFDAAGNLWGITDRGAVDPTVGSQILSIDKNTGKATVVSTTQTVYAFESLAVAAPAGCDPVVIPPVPDSYVPIPVWSAAGAWIAGLLLLLTGCGVIRRQRH